MSRTAFNALIGDFGKHLGVPAIVADEDGYVALTFDEIELHLQFDDEHDEVVIFTSMGQIEPDRAAEIYGMLLGANLFWHGGRGATFSAEPALGRIFLADRQPVAGLSLAHLNGWLEIFLDTAAHWQKRLTTANEGGALTYPMEFDEQVSESDHVEHHGLEFHLNKA